MAEKTFDLNTKGIEKMVKLFRKMPREFAKGTGSMLNDFAFGTRNTSFEVIQESMVVRSRAFVNSRFRVEKTHRRMPMETQEATVGSIFSKRHSGWREQQTGEKTARERTITELGRLKNRTRKLVGSARFKKENVFESHRDYKGKSVEHRNIVMMQTLDRRRWKKPFIISGKKGMISGLYKFFRRKPRLLQVFDSKKLQPKRIPWMEDAITRYFQREDLGRLWKGTMRRMLRLPPG